MKASILATRRNALLSGVVLGLGMPSLESVAEAPQLPSAIQQAVFVTGLFFLFFVPVLLFVVGSAYLGYDSKDMVKKTYWSSLGQVGTRALVWLVGCGLGFAALAALHRVIA